MPNPLVPLGSLNRLKAQLVIPGSPELNAVSGNFGKAGLRVTFEGNAVTYHDVMTGAVPSPEPYQRLTITAHLLKTQPVAALWFARVQVNALIGDAMVFPDVEPSLGGLGQILLNNCGIQNPRDLAFDGSDPDYTVTIGAYLSLNSVLFD